MDLVAELSRLAGLHAEGTLTDDEFVQAKARLLGSHSAPRLAASDKVSPAEADPVAAAQSTPVEDDIVPSGSPSWGSDLPAARSTPRNPRRRSRVLLVPQEAGGVRRNVVIAASVTAVVLLAAASQPLRLKTGRRLVSSPPGSSDAEDAAVSYEADDESAFAQAGHGCSDLRAWYEHNPYDSNADIAHQYYDI